MQAEHKGNAGGACRHSDPGQFIRGKRGRGRRPGRASGALGRGIAAPTAKGGLDVWSCGLRWERRVKIEDQGNCGNFREVAPSGHPELVKPKLASFAANPGRTIFPSRKTALLARDLRCGTTGSTPLVRCRWAGAAGKSAIRPVRPPCPRSHTVTLRAQGTTIATAPIREDRRKELLPPTVEHAPRSPSENRARKNEAQVPFVSRWFFQLFQPARLAEGG